MRISDLSEENRYALEIFHAQSREEVLKIMKKYNRKETMLPNDKKEKNNE